MLQLRPVCEHCGMALPPASGEAMICSYECTLCQACVEAVLHTVCPNCGGGFCPRPVRPARNLRGGNYLGNHPASDRAVFKPVDPQAHERFSAALRQILPQKR